MSTDTYKPAKAYAAEVRAAIKAAQKSGQLDPTWKIRVRTDQASMCSEVGVSIENVTDEFLFTAAPADDPYHRDHVWSEPAIALASQVRKLMDPIVGDWEDGRMHFAFLYFRDGLMAP